MNSIDMPFFAFSPASSSRICACTVTSSAVVGSSAISSSRLVGERHGDHHALALAAGELVRIGAEPLLRLADADLVEQLQRARARLPLAHALVQAEDLADLLLDRVQRIERGHRLLEDHGDLVAAHLPQLLLVERQQVLALEEDLAGRVAGRRVGQQLQHRQRR